MKSLRYISAQPATMFYAWQVEVMLNNFIKNGVTTEQLHVVAAITNDIVPTEWLKLQDKYRDIRFFFYNDTRQIKIYPPSIRPHVFKKHFTEHPELSNCAIFQHDCDMVFTKPVNWDKFLNDDIWYCSDTISYIGANYIKSKKYGVYERMCEIVDISESIPIKNELNSGGAQYIMKNIDATYWDKVERDGDTLYQFFMNHLKAFPQSQHYHPIQAWTAEMWAVLWNAWYFKHETRVVKELEFAWPNHREFDWNNKSIYHNAGVLGNKTDPGLFYKMEYTNKLPYNINPEDIRLDSCSYKYVLEILETSKTSCLK